jgi:glutaredoxin
MQSKNSIVYSQPNCAGCVAVKALLTSKGYAVEERVLGNGWTKEQLYADAPNVRSVPQVLINGTLVGGLKEVQEFVRD